MIADAFRISLPLPAQGAAETEATIVQWHVGSGDQFTKGQVLAEIDSAKSVFDFEAPCDGVVVEILHAAETTVSYEEAVLEIETTNPEMKDWIPPAAAATDSSVVPMPVAAPVAGRSVATCSILGIGAHLPTRVVTNAELVEAFPDITAEYVEQVTGVRERHWVADDEKPSDLAYAASLEAIGNAGIPADSIDAVILATATPDVAMPSTACILQQRLGLRPGPAFDLNAACSGWLYAISMARGMIAAGMAENILTVGVDVQSRLLDRTDHTTCFLFADGAGAAVVSAGDRGHALRHTLLGADAAGLQLARRERPGFVVGGAADDHDPWIRMDGPALFRFATEGFSSMIRNVVEQTGWTLDEITWVVPHQANSRILKAAAKRCGMPFDRVYINVNRVGNTSSASIPLAISEVQDSLSPGDKLVLCSVGAGITTAAATIEW